MRNALALFGILLLLQGCLVPANFESVIVLDSESNRIKTLNREEVAEFEAQWYKFKGVEKLPASLSSSDILYKFDIVAEEERFSGRWLYYPSGYVAKLNKSLKPAFAIEDQNEFSKTLGI
jgi:hypothetical protein